MKTQQTEIMQCVYVEERTRGPCIPGTCKSADKKIVPLTITDLI